MSLRSFLKQRKGLLLALGLVLIPCLAFIFIIVSPVTSETLCGEGSAAENYGFSYSLQQLHWTVNGEPHVTSATISEVDEILDQLDYENIAQTMILFKPAGEVGNRVNCAVHFLRYMKLGQPIGERKDNGFVFLVVVEERGIDVHYGVGLGLPALTAQGLTPLNRLAESTYDSTGSMDEALLALVRSFDEYARSKYPPYFQPSPTPEYVSISGPTTWWEYCLCCLTVLIILVVLVILLRLMARSGRRSGGGGWNFPSGGGGGWSPPSGGFKLPTMRGGSGSGRSGRGN